MVYTVTSLRRHSMQGLLNHPEFESTPQRHSKPQSRSQSPFSSPIFHFDNKYNHPPYNYSMHIIHPFNLFSPRKVVLATASSETKYIPTIHAGVPPPPHSINAKPNIIDLSSPLSSYQEVYASTLQPSSRISSQLTSLGPNDATRTLAASVQLTGVHFGYLGHGRLGGVAGCGVAVRVGVVALQTGHQGVEQVT